MGCTCLGSVGAGADVVDGAWVVMDAVWSRTAERADDGGVSVGGADLRELAGEFGTPLYVIDEADMRGRATVLPRRLCGRPSRRTALQVDVYYASKAFLSSRVSAWMCEDGLSIDVASGGELELALRGGMPRRAHWAARQQQVRR